MPSFHKESSRFSGLFAILALLGACTTTLQGPISGPFHNGPSLAGLDRGSSLRANFSDDDREGMSQAAGELLQGGQSNSSKSWRVNNGDNGTVRLGGPVLVGLDSLNGAAIAAPEGIDTSVPLEIASGNYSAEKQVNVRLAPATTAPIAQSLPPGSLVRAFAKAHEWLLVGSPDAVYGYAFAQLLTDKGGGDPVLAGGRAHRPRLCRTMSLTVTLASGARDLWSQLVCKKDDGAYEVAPERGLS